MSVILENLFDKPPTMNEAAKEMGSSHQNVKQIASNFIAYKGLNIGEGYDEFERYAIVKQTIEENNETLIRKQTIGLIADVSIYGYVGEDKLQWTVVYNMTGLNGYSFGHRNTENVLEFKLKQIY